MPTNAINKMQSKSQYVLINAANASSEKKKQKGKSTATTNQHKQQFIPCQQQITSMIPLMHLPTILHKRLLMHQPHKPPLPQHTNIPQPQLNKTLIHQIHRRANLQRHRRNIDVRREVRRVWALLRVFGHVVAQALRSEEWVCGAGVGAGAAEVAVLVAFVAFVFVFRGGGGGEGEDSAAAWTGPFLLRAHEAEGGGLALEAVEGEFEVWAGDEADQDAVA